MRSVTALQRLIEEEATTRRLSVGCGQLDASLQGGFPLQGITEIAGEAGAGKTQFALSLSLQCCLPPAYGGLGGKAAYLCCGEGEFPFRRLAQIATSLSNRLGISSHEELLQNVQINQCHNSDDVLDALKKKLPTMCASDNVRLVVIDSIAGMVRNDYETKSVGDMSLRTVLLFKVAKELKWLADIYNVCVLVINQVTAKGFENSSSSSNNNDCSPALGLAWSHCVNTRICLRRDTIDMRSLGPHNTVGQEVTYEDENYSSVTQHNNIDNDINNNNGATAFVPYHSTNADSNFNNNNNNNNRNNISSSNKSLRTLVVEFSPYLPRTTCAYQITADGVIGIRM